MIRNPKALRFLAVAWVAAYSAAAYAFTRYSQDMKGFDYESLLWALSAALIGAAAQTIFRLASDEAIVLSLFRTICKDAAIAVVGGGIVYLVLQAVASYWPALITKELRMLAIVYAGFSRGRWNSWIERWVDSGAANINARIRGSQQPPSRPTTITAPLDK